MEAIKAWVSTLQENYKLLHWEQGQEQNQSTIQNASSILPNHQRR